MDYVKEYQIIKAFEPTKYFKAPAGRHEVTFLSEAEETSYKDEDSGEETKQVEFKVSVGQESMFWTVAKGQSFKSLYGQLMAVGNQYKKLKDKTITLLVTGSGTAKTYVVLEALPYIAEETQKEISSTLEGV